jgi:hypothetical protein
MGKRQHRATSKEAHESVKEHKPAMYEKIKAALEKLKIGGTFEQIALCGGLKPAQVHKRLPEMIELGIVYNVGVTRRTSSGRKSMVRQLVGLKYVDDQNPKTDQEIKDLKNAGVPVQSDNQIFLDALLEGRLDTPIQQSYQQKLF